MRKYIIIVPCAKKSNCQKAVSQAELPISGIIWPISYIISHKLELMTLYPFDCGQIFGLSVSVFRISLWLLRDVLASAKLQCGNLFRKSGFVSEYRSPSAGDPRYGRWGNSKVPKQREREKHRHISELSSLVRVMLDRLPSTFALFLRLSLGFFHSKLWNSVSVGKSFVYRVLLFTYICHVDRMIRAIHPGNKINCLILLFAFLCCFFFRNKDITQHNKCITKQQFHVCWWSLDEKLIPSFHFWWVVDFLSPEEVMCFFSGNRWWATDDMHRQWFTSLK